MWSPLNVFFVIWICNFTTIQNGRLNVNQVIESREKTLIEKIVQEKENKIICNTIDLRNDF
jgi:methyl coenzyme M reductase gamma subunit